MFLQILFPHLRGFRLLSYHKEIKRLVIICERVTRTAHCPVCGTSAHRIHSRYERTIWDQSIQNEQVMLHLHVRKFYCDHPGCPRRIFTERLPLVTSPHGRYTFGLRQLLGQLGLEQGRASGARSANLLGMQTTSRAILRFMHALPLPAIVDPQIIGIDEWAWKRRQRYGTIIVDLERKKPIALLPDCSQQTVIQWLKCYPTIKIVARDRSKEFAAAITAALPQAKHVADRWHVAKNLTEQLDKVVSARWKQLTKARCEAETSPGAVLVTPQPERPRQSFGEERYQQALALKEASFPTRTIAKRLGVGARTIQRWLAQEHGPYTGQRKPRRSPLDWSTRYLRERWEAGERKGVVLWEELRVQGYSGSIRSVYRRLAAWRDHSSQRGAPTSTGVVARSPLEDVTPGQIVRWMVVRPETLTSEAEAQLERLCQIDGILAQARELIRGFLDLIRPRDAQRGYIAEQ